MLRAASPVCVSPVPRLALIQSLPVSLPSPGGFEEGWERRAVLLLPLSPWGQLSAAGVTELLTPWAGRVAEGAWVGVTCAAETAERCTQPPVGS